jgi:TolB-like protein/cytochrome c-type biogenesis protein CcmH/NrfG
MKFRRLVGATAGLVLGAGCASVQPTPQVAITRLESQRTASPKSVEVLRALGVQYYKAQRYQDARATLTEAAAIAPNDGVTALYLGLSAEAMNDLPAAKAAYSSYLKVGRTQRVRRQLEGRMAAMQRRELQDAAKAAVRQELTLSTTPGNRTTVAVMPFRFTGADSTLQPLERGFAELLTTDLSRVSALTVVERARLSAILDEIKLSQSGAVDSTTALRAGKLIQAGTLVQGSLIQNGNRLRTDAALVSVATSSIGTAPATDEQNLDRVFDMEKTIALALIQSLGVPLTTAERNAIEQRPTRNLQAFLAYSQGLTYEDQGRYDEASRAYGNAARIDPGFGAAAQKSAQTASMSLGSGNAANIEASLQGSSEGSVVNAANQGSATSASQPTGSAQNAAESLNPSTTAAATSGTATATSTPKTDPSAGTGADNPAKAKVVITIKPPTE